MKEARSKLLTAIEDFCRSFNSKRITPIMEADVAGFLYHRLVTHGCSLNSIYLASRICGKSERSRKPDIVVGSLNKANGCVQPRLICELKVFQRWGHSDQQKRRRFEGILDQDIPTLTQLEEYLPRGRIQVVVDLHKSPKLLGYMTGTWKGNFRVDVVRERCRAAGVSFYWAHEERDTETICVEKVI